MTPLIRPTVSELLGQLSGGQRTSVEVCGAYLDAIERRDGAIGAFLRVDREAAMRQAAEIDARRNRGESLGELAGVPVAVKDLLCTRGEPTTCGSRMLQNFVPPYDATVIARLRRADAVILGKTNLDEFAMGGSTENSALGRTVNPWNLACVPGGSSGGAAACVAAGMVPLSVGTDTGGSIRQPASFCGVVGLKPTYGRVSRYGLVAFASSLDQVGPLAATVEDVARLLQVMAGHDGQDATSAPVDVPNYVAEIAQPLQGLKLGLPREYFAEGLDSEVERAVRDALDVYRSMGAEICDISLPHSRYGIATYYIIAPCEASSNLARFDGAHFGYRCDESAMRAQLQSDLQQAMASGRPADIDSPLVRMYRQSRSEGFGPEVKRRIMLGTYALSAGYYDAYYLKALKVRRLIRQDFDGVFSEVDFVVGPVTPSVAFALGERTDDPLAMYLGDLYTVAANLAGLPAISLPAGFSTQGLPIGLQLQGRPFDEARLLRAAAMFQQATDWHTRVPELP